MKRAGVREKGLGSLGVKWHCAVTGTLCWCQEVLSPVPSRSSHCVPPMEDSLEAVNFCDFTNTARALFLCRFQKETCCCCQVTSVVSDSVRPHRWQPTRLPCPWDSPGKNTGVGCHFLLQCMKVKSEREVTRSCPTLHDPMDCSLPGSSIHGIFQGRILEWGAIAFSKRRHSSVQLYAHLYRLISRTVLNIQCVYLSAQAVPHFSLLFSVCLIQDVYDSLN